MAMELEQLKVFRLEPTIGSAGVIQFPESKGWTVEEILYFGERHVVYTASKAGSIGLMCYQHHGGGPRQLRWKALNRLCSMISMVDVLYKVYQCLVYVSVDAILYMYIYTRA